MKKNILSGWMKRSRLNKWTYASMIVLNYPRLGTTRLKRKQQN